MGRITRLRFVVREFVLGLGFRFLSRVAGKEEVEGGSVLPFYGCLIVYAR